MIDLTWKLFKETGSIESYLLFKELENDHHNSIEFGQMEIEKESPLESK
ncbi:YqzL family protein [Oceanobacillus sp. Castelsardo]|nr:YqzL family protein [Oceanobacillus sp. Castelsardo]